MPRNMFASTRKKRSRRAGSPKGPKGFGDKHGAGYHRSKRSTRVARRSVNRGLGRDRA